MELDVTNESLPVYQALASEIRLEIIRRIANGTHTAALLSKDMSLSESAISKNLNILIRAGLITKHSNKDNRKNDLELSVQNINVQFPSIIFPKYQKLSYSVPIGSYFQISKITSSCGLASQEHVIGKFDDPNVFLLPERFTAELMWFTNGTVTYKIPNQIPQTAMPKMVELSFEISSEFPASNNNWPSDIGCWINDQFVGKFSVSGNFSDVRGRLTPNWWSNDLSQYGQLKQLRITDKDTGVNGSQISLFNLRQLDLEQSDSINLTLGVLKTNDESHGLTLFGKGFGNYDQDLQVLIYYATPS
ncbi:ArsR family transcriptional regulator [Loigolactobacillus coryniformis]|uniref:ArsR/SmtB family transcription factor n=1 Tax=Loigolactobacillus coryniformis TaxID=1610 RepID=UPI002341740A|nr:helix-turn-helix domain-containing protein [Loigolactobacillus coryniformis]MDC4185241.1 ArsR family transcriptional regulator [Loigolactobacillus coryniformis]